MFVRDLHPEAEKAMREISRITAKIAVNLPKEVAKARGPKARSARRRHRRA
jgi:ferric-dicitrate binding protein FerR (iron transport regulator)